MKFSKDDRVEIRVNDKVVVFDYCNKEKNLPIDGAVAQLDGLYGPKLNKKFSELFYVLKGSMIIDVEGEESRLEKGDVFIVLPEKEHTIYGEGAKVFIACSPQFDPKNVVMTEKSI